MTFQWSSPRVSLLIVSLVLALIAAGGAYAQSPTQNGQQPSPVQRVPSGVILVKGAWASASDTVTPLPEGGEVTHNVYQNSYFRLSYSLARDWVKKYDGPPPSDSGYYVLAQVEPGDTFKGAVRGSIMITAADLFFTPTGATSALQLITSTRDNLRADYKVSRAPTQITLGGHSFVRFDYFSPVAGLYWYVLATQIRCHTVQFVFSSRDVRLLDQLLKDVATQMKIPEEVELTRGTGGGDVPVCIKDYASPENLVERVDPILADRRFNPIPVRVIIDTEGRIKHIHFLSAFPEQSQAITDALRQWKFKPYLRDGRPVEVETGILFGRAAGINSQPYQTAARDAPVSSAAGRDQRHSF